MEGLLLRRVEDRCENDELLDRLQDHLHAMAERERALLDAVSAEHEPDLV